jgi:hypothetical protein
MELDYDIFKPKESAKKIYKELKSLPLEIRESLQDLIRESSLTERSKQISEIQRISFEKSHRFIEDSDLLDSED